MARKHQAVSWLSQGNAPSEIAANMGVSLETVMGYLYNQVGEGKLRRSDILFSIGDDTRQAVETIENRHGQLDRWIFQQIIREEHPGVNPDEAWIYRDLRKPEVYFGDMYWYLYTFESLLHAYVQLVLRKSYGDAWWDNGIPENIRIDCQIARERDPDRVTEPYCYTTLIHVKEIIDRRWSLFSKYFPKGAASRKQEFLAGLTRINQIRNRVMHAAKGAVPTEDDFRTLRDFLAFADITNWKHEPSTSTLIADDTVPDIR